VSFWQLTGEKDVLLNPFSVRFVSSEAAQFDSVFHEFDGRGLIPNRSAPVTELITSRPALLPAFFAEDERSFFEARFAEVGLILCDGSIAALAGPLEFRFRPSLW
jgi:hypothetical protein